MEELAVNPDYEYEAPQFFDFHNILKRQEDDEHVDSWFDGKPDDEGGVKIPEEPENVESECPKPEDSKPHTTQTVDIVNEKELNTNNESCKNEEIKPKESEIKSENPIYTEEVVDATVPCENNAVDNGCEPKVENNEAVDNEAKPKETKRSNIVTSWNKAKDSQLDADKGDHTDTTDENLPEKDEPKMITRAQKRNHALNVSVSSGLLSKKPKDSTPNNNKIVPSKRSRSLCSNPDKKALSATIPITPECLKRQKANKPAMIKLKTTEEMEMERIAKMRKKTRQQIKANETTMKKAIACTSYHPVRMNGADPTKPEEFHFETDKRVKSVVQSTTTVATGVGDDPAKDFLKSLRQHPPSPTWKQRKITIPKPFNLTADGSSKRKRSAIENDASSASDSYESMAYQVYKFQTTTPPRFRTKRQRNEPSSESDPDQRVETSAPAPRVTLPKTPNLATSSRSRPIAADVISRDEQEEKEAEAIKSYHFKAKPFDRRIVEYDGAFGVKRPKGKQLTEAVPFSFESNERLEVKKNEKIAQIQVEDNIVQFKAGPQPNFEKVFRPQLQHKRTAQQPFSFDEKDKERWQKKEGKIQDVYKEEEKLREFKALPLPSDSPDSLPAISSKSCTSFKPFALNTENRGAVKAEKWIQKVKSDLEEERKKTVFKAQPSKVTQEAPFEPQKSQKALTEVSEFALNMNRRAERWDEINTEKKEIKHINDELWKEREAEREEEEKEAIAELRRKLVHKAKPIHKYKTVVVKPSEKALTHPTSPTWSDMKRRRMENFR